MDKDKILWVVFGVCLGVGLYGAFGKGRSPISGVINLIIATVAGFLSYYAFVESSSQPWGIGYACVGVLFLVLTTLSFRGGG